MVPAASRPVLEINPRHTLVTRLSALGEAEAELREDAARLLFDEARIADGEAPVDPRAFSARLARVLGRAWRPRQSKNAIRQSRSRASQRCA